MKAAAALLLLMTTVAPMALADTECPDQVSYANGNTLRDGRTFYYPNGQLILQNDDTTMYYPSGAVFKSGTSTYYPDGHILQQGVDDLYYPNGVVMRTYNNGANSYDYNYDTGRPLVRGDTLYNPDGSVANPAPAAGKPSPVRTGPVKLSVPVLSYGTIEASDDAGFVSVDVFLNHMLPDAGGGATGITGVIVPVGLSTGPAAAPASLQAIVQWPDMNYRPYYSIILPTGAGPQWADLDSDAGLTTCNLVAP